MVDSRRGDDAPDDIVSRLVRCELDGELLSKTVLRILTANFVLGGISTTTNLIASLLWRILQSTELHAELRARPELIPAAVEETLRLDPPVLFVMRQCRATTEVAGTLLAPGEKIVVGVAAMAGSCSPAQSFGKLSFGPRLILLVVCDLGLALVKQSLDGAIEPPIHGRAEEWLGFDGDHPLLCLLGLTDGLHLFHQLLTVQMPVSEVPTEDGPTKGLPFLPFVVVDVVGE